MLCIPSLLGQICDCFVSVYPNAGLPNAMGGYDDTPAEMAAQVKVPRSLLLSFACFSQRFLSCVSAVMDN